MLGGEALPLDHAEHRLRGRGRLGPSLGPAAPAAAAARRRRAGVEGGTQLDLPGPDLPGPDAPGRVAPGTISPCTRVRNVPEPARPGSAGSGGPARRGCRARPRPGCAGVAGQRGHRQGRRTGPAHLADGEPPAPAGHREHVTEVPPPASARERSLLAAPARAGRARRPARRRGSGGVPVGTRVARSASLACWLPGGEPGVLQGQRDPGGQVLRQPLHLPGRPPAVRAAQDEQPQRAAPGGQREAPGAPGRPGQPRRAGPAPGPARPAARSARAPGLRAPAAMAGGARSQPRFSSQVSAPACDSSAWRATVSRRSPPGPGRSTAHQAASRGTATCPATARIRSWSTGRPAAYRLRPAPRSGPAGPVPARPAGPVRAPGPSGPPAAAAAGPRPPRTVRGGQPRRPGSRSPGHPPSMARSRRTARYAATRPGQARCLRARPDAVLVRDQGIRAVGGRDVPRRRHALVQQRVIPGRSRRVVERHGAGRHRTGRPRASPAPYWPTWGPSARGSPVRWLATRPPVRRR